MLSRVIVLMHHKEAIRSSNSGKLAALALRGAEVRLRGERGARLSGAGLLDDPAYPPRVLYPQEDAPPLRSEDGPCTLLVPDGNWRQARKLMMREPDFAAAPVRRLPSVIEATPSIYTLRSHPNPDFISTAEAIILALRVLGEAEGAARLEHTLRMFVDRTLWARGRIARERIYGGL